LTEFAHQHRIIVNSVIEDIGVMFGAEETFNPVYDAAEVRPSD
jgi:hypothetical protein